MASLKRLDLLVRGNSTISQDGALEFAKNWSNRRQESDTNKDENGDYILEFYVDLYDSRTNKGWKVFSDVATQNRAIENTYTKENGEVIEGVIFTLPFNDDVNNLQNQISLLKAELAILKADLLNDNNGFKLIV